MSLKISFGKLKSLIDHKAKIKEIKKMAKKTITIVFDYPSPNLFPTFLT